MKSLLDILKQEKSLVDEFELYDHYLAITQNQLDSIKRYGIDCEAYQHDVKTYNSMIDDYHAAQANILDQLKSCREEMREYLHELGL